MSIYNANSFSSSETLSKMHILSHLQKRDRDELLRCENCSSLLLAVTLPALFVFICCSFHILNSFSSYLNCYLCEVDIYLFSFVLLSGTSQKIKFGRLWRSSCLYSLTLWIEIALFLDNSPQTLLAVLCIQKALKPCDCYWGLIMLGESSVARVEHVISVGS